MVSQSSEAASSLPVLPARAAESHKGDYGRALLVGGSRGMSGAIALAGMACLRSGAGLVTLAVPDRCLEVVAAFEPSYMTVPLPCDQEGRLTVAAQARLAELADTATCLACGPGLGRSPQLTQLVGWMYEALPQPMVLDADALFALAQMATRLDEPAGPRVLTPHLGEFRRLVADPALDREQAEVLSVQWAAANRSVLVLKGHRTLITDGGASWYNTTGNPGMATGGAGDVLTGVITALIGQGLPPVAAARLGVHVHGLAGDIAAEQLGQTSLIASDLVRCLPQAFRRLDEHPG